ncbi:hypothetical protein ZIOFF_036653 [Zingiber officinale]|uniref:ARM repeat superfamily protein n=1 Tax=Zingiber officinale TaxID=94328 RepID=A0A8J5GIW0_ZINOF|nr:hypothetical protein ZIOFF_036653 [Zingiber officinale]
MGTRSSICEKTSVINFGSLEAGSTQATRFAAAKQIGDIAKSHPQELNSHLKKIIHHTPAGLVALCKLIMIAIGIEKFPNISEARTGIQELLAARAVGSIAENVKHISLKELLKSLEAELAEVGFSDASRDVGVSFSNICPNTTTGLSFKRCWNLDLHCWHQMDRCQNEVFDHNSDVVRGRGDVGWRVVAMETSLWSYRWTLDDFVGAGSNEGGTCYNVFLMKSVRYQAVRRSGTRVREFS